MLSPDQLWDKWKSRLHWWIDGFGWIDLHEDDLCDEFMQDLKAYGEWRDFMQAKAEAEADGNIQTD